VSRGGGFLRDNLEAFAVAIAMALVIRHYCIEAFRIPTGSMMPTLLGDRGPDGSRRYGDRILVDKYIYLRRDPRRFEVAVFQYPLNRSKNFIKRIAGLPDEWLRVVNGDLWTSTDDGATWTIQRKPAGARDQLFFAYYPEPPENPAAFRGVNCWEADDGWQIDEEQQVFAVEAKDKPATIEFLRKVMPYDDVDDGRFSQRPYVGDVRLSFDIDVESAGTLTLRLIEHGTTYRCVLGADESYVQFGDGKRVALDFKLEASHDVSFANTDDMLVVELDGHVREIPYPVQGTEPPTEEEFAPEGKWMHHAILIDAQQCVADLHDVRIDRDIHYGVRDDPDKVWKIPAGHYFMLGDNTQHSKDSRGWRIAEAYLDNGDVIRWEPDARDGTDNPVGGRPPGGDEYVNQVEADIDGLTRSFRSGDAERWRTDVAWPFVSRDHLIGRAFSVFWPIYLPPLSKSPTRLKLIR